MSLFGNLIAQPFDTLIVDLSQTHLFSATEVEAMVLQPYEMLYAQGTIYLNGATLIAYSRHNSNPYNQGVSFFRYDSGYGLRRPYVGLLPNATVDNHALTPLFQDTTGYFYAYRENPHSTPIEIFKSRAINDISVWEKLSETIGPADLLAYPKAIPDGSGNAVAWLRSWTGTDSFGVIQYRASAGGQTFGSGVQLLAQVDESVFGGRHYPTLPLRYLANGWYFLEITFRDDPSINWRTRYVLKTQNFEDFFNFQETFSEDITSSSISTAELANYQAYSTASGKNMYAPVSSVDANGNYFSIVTDGDDNYFILYFAGGAWQTKAITIPDTIIDGSTLGNDQLSPFCTLIVYSVTRMDVIVRCLTDVGGTDYAHLKLFRTENFGDDFFLVADLNQGIADNFLKNSWPFNYYDIPQNKNFAIVMFNIDTPAKAYLVALSKGFPEAGGGVWPVNTLTQLDDIADLHRHYRISAADCARTGTTITNLTDLSGNGADVTNANFANSPQLDDGTNPTFLTFNGTNQYFLIPTTGATALTQGTCFAVVRHKTTHSSAAVILSMGATANALYHSMQVRKDAGLEGINVHSSYGVGETNEVIGQDNTTSDTLFFVVGFVVDSQSTQLYVNGVRQYFEFDRVGSGTDLAGRLQAGRLYSNVTSANRWACGALVRSTIVYTSFDIKEIAFWTRALNNQEILEVQKKLGADHGITIASPHPLM